MFFSVCVCVFEFFGASSLCFFFVLLIVLCLAMPATLKAGASALAGLVLSCQSPKVGGHICVCVCLVWAGLHTSLSVRVGTFVFV